MSGSLLLLCDVIRQVVRTVHSSRFIDRTTQNLFVTLFVVVLVVVITLLHIVLVFSPHWHTFYGNHDDNDEYVQEE